MSSLSSLGFVLGVDLNLPQDKGYGEHSFSSLMSLLVVVKVFNRDRMMMTSTTLNLLTYSKKSKSSSLFSVLSLMHLSEMIDEMVQFVLCFIQRSQQQEMKMWHLSSQKRKGDWSHCRPSSSSLDVFLSDCLSSNPSWDEKRWHLLPLSLTSCRTIIRRTRHDTPFVFLQGMREN